MKWVPLKIYQSEILIREVEAVESKYDNLINKVRCSSPDDDKAKSEFLAFRDEIEQRILELDEFYQMNITDSRIGAFDKIRNRLANLIEISIDSGNEIIRKTYINTNEAGSLSSLQPRESQIGLTSNLRTNSKTRSKLYMSSANMRHSTVRQSSTSKMFGGEYAKWKEVVFKIRLTENEYKLLMQEKSKDVLKI